MPASDQIAALTREIAAWRHDFHHHPELLYDVHRTAGIVADKLQEFGCDEVVTGIGRTGVVGVINGPPSNTVRARLIGLRADMDALPIAEATGLPYASTDSGHDARLRPRRPHRDAARRRHVSRRDAQFRRHRRRHLPARRGRRRRRQGHGRGRPDGRASASRRSTACTTCRGCRVGHFATAAGPAAGRDRPLRHHRRGPRRPRGAAAQSRRPVVDRRQIVYGAADHRLAQRRPAGIGGRLGHRVPGRRRLQRHSRRRPS